MGHRQAKTAGIKRWGILALLLCLAAAAAQTQQGAAPSASSLAVDGASPAASHSTHHPKSTARITPEQAKQLFALVDELIRFSSDDTGLPVKSTVKRQLTTQAAVESYLDEKLNEDEDAKRLQRDEVVLKKFGLLDRDFELKPFLLALLKEQIEAYYDSKTKTVNLLDWVDPEEQKPVMAHELTHALQDQHCDLEKWDDQTPIDVSHDAAGDEDHLARDEMDTARDAVAEGQATAVMMDYILKPLGKSIVKDPEVLDEVRSQMNSSEDSPVMARAPLLLSESMLFPYREGLSFEQDVWMDQGQPAAFAGTLDRPPTSSWEIINPRMYEQKRIPAIPLLPDIHPLVDPLYTPYDIGQIGELDVHIITELLGGDDAANDLTPAWDGGLYWAGQSRSAKTPAELASTKSIGLFYLSVWRNADSAEVFAKLYARNLGRKYSGVHLETVSGPSDDGSVEQIYSTNEGPAAITTRGKMVFVTESFPLPLARNLASLILDAQVGGATRFAGPPLPEAAPAARSVDGDRTPPAPLTASLVHFFEGCGVMKAAVDAVVRAGR
ncbi:MAG: hypothetical protein ABSF23_10770 [Terracidiphilus sp.]|jgi:hypothetical protein